MLRGRGAPSPACRGGLGRGCSLLQRSKASPPPNLPLQAGGGAEPKPKPKPKQHRALRKPALVAAQQRPTESRAQRAPLYPGPRCGGEVGDDRPARESTGMSTPFCQDRIPVESPSPAPGLAGQGCPASAKRGGLLFGLLFSWPSKRKVTRPPQEDETPCTRTC